MFVSCKRNEGEGGTGVVQGYVMLINHPDDNYTLPADTIVAAKTDVFIVYGNSDFYGDDVETDDKGFYKFKYLTPGNYTVFAYSTLASGDKVPVTASISIGKGETGNVPTIYVHQGKAYGTSIVTGKVYAMYFHNDTYRGQGWAYEHRVYIRKEGDPYHFDDVRVGLDGVFAFQKLQPGNYEVFTFTENSAEVPSPLIETISVENIGEIIEMEPDTTFVVRIQV
ncbi:MAG: hypothetical protein CW336_07970 [Bacteroidetes bacterium]|jgi:hypothetical protein|nr:hypothetical protein [Bacteroidota bacterium]